MHIRDRLGLFINSESVQNWIMGLIILNAITLGLETSTLVMTRFGVILGTLDQILLSIFIAELCAKIYHKGLKFFKDGWNIFDFIIISISLVPSGGALTILRALRILRVLRLLSIVPQMRIVVQALFKAMPAMVSVVTLILLIFYVGAVLATNLFASEFDQWFGHIGQSMYTLFQIMTLESWSMGIVRPVMEIYPLAWIFFIPFILITSFAVINLFIGVIVDAMQSQGGVIDSNPEVNMNTIDKKLKLLEKEVGEIRTLIHLNRNNHS